MPLADFHGGLRILAFKDDDDLAWHISILILVADWPIVHECDRNVIDRSQSILISTQSWQVWLWLTQHGHQLTKNNVNVWCSNLKCGNIMGWDNIGGKHCINLETKQKIGSSGFKKFSHDRLVNLSGKTSKMKAKICRLPLGSVSLQHIRGSSQRYLVHTAQSAQSAEQILHGLNFSVLLNLKTSVSEIWIRRKTVQDFVRHDWGEITHLF
jgi:hypothetical protein